MASNGSLCENYPGTRDRYLNILKGNLPSKRNPVTLLSHLFTAMPHIQALPLEQLHVPKLEDFIEADNVVRVLDAFVDSLDLQALGFDLPIS